MAIVSLRNEHISKQVASTTHVARDGSVSRGFLAMNVFCVEQVVRLKSPGDLETQP